MPGGCRSIDDDIGKLGTGAHEQMVRAVRVTRRLQFGFGIPIAILIALSVVSYRRVVASATGALSVQHTHQVIERLAALLSATQDIETGYRGFVLAGDERFLVPYKDGL